jgi:glycosyltransferase involved in cell wall biosynthesis
MTSLRNVRRGAVAAGTALAIAGAVHSWINLRRLRVLPSATTDRTPDSDDEHRWHISVLIPARDEAGHVGHCLETVRAQQGVDIDEIVVFEDRSSDGTAQVVSHHLSDPRVRLIEADREPPPGWLGKTWACHQLARAATGDLLVFVDADVRLAPDAVARIVSAMQASNLDAVSPYPRQLALTWSERVAQPLLQWSWATLLPLGLAEASPRPSLVAANGQLMAITRDAYDGCGGHQAIRSAVLDDIALFAQLKRSGRRAVLADGTGVAACRMYDDWPSLRDGYTKSLWAATGSPAGAAVIAGTLTTAYIAPPLAMLIGRSRVGVVGYAAAVASRAVVARRVEGSVWPDSMLHPASIAMFDYLLVRSWIGRRRGTLRWRGRPVPPNPAECTSG